MFVGLYTIINHYNPHELVRYIYHKPLEFNHLFQATERELDRGPHPVVPWKTIYNLRKR